MLVRTVMGFVRYVLVAKVSIASIALHGKKI